MVLSLAPMSAPAQAKGPAGFFGVTSSSAATNADLQRMGAARVGVLRQPFGWAGLEPNPGSYNFADTDRVVANAASQGITMRPFIYGTPSWARNCAGVPAAFCDRVTPLRSASGRSRWPALMRALDRELPQLINVIRGDMSIVGPRPEQVELVERYEQDQRFRLEVKPGVTGPMQVNGRAHLTFTERLAVELDYVENLSLARDLRLLMLTLPAVARRNGAF